MRPCCGTSTAHRTPCTRWPATPTPINRSFSKGENESDRPPRRRHPQTRDRVRDGPPPAGGRRARGDRRHRRGPEPAGVARGEPRLVQRDHHGDVREPQGLGHRRGRRGRRLRAGAARLADQVPDDGPAAEGAARGSAAAAHADRREVPRPPHTGGRGHVRREARARVTTAADLRPLLLSPEAAAALDAPGTKDAAVLVPLYLDSGALHAVFTKRRDDLKRHAGEISFPGGRQDFPDEDLRTTALREAEEEIGLAPADVELVGALEP